MAATFLQGKTTKLTKPYTIHVPGSTLAAKILQDLKEGASPHLANLFGDEQREKLSARALVIMRQSNKLLCQRAGGVDSNVCHDVERRTHNCE